MTRVQTRSLIDKRVAEWRYGYAKGISWVGAALALVLIIQDVAIILTDAAPHQDRFLALHGALLIGSTVSGYLLSVQRYRHRRGLALWILVSVCLSYAVGSTWADIGQVGTIAGFVIILLVVAVAVAWPLKRSIAVFALAYAGFLAVVIPAAISDPVRTSALVNGTVTVLVSITVSTLQYRARVNSIGSQLRAEESNRLLRGITDNMFDMVLVVDSQGVTTFVSGSHQQLGHDPAALVGRSAFELVHPEERDDIVKRYAEGFAARNSQTADYRVRRADGGYAWVEAAWIFLGSDPDRGMEALICSRDITNRREAEEALRTAKEEALAASTAKSVFLANMSHEIRTPLNGVIGFIDLLRESKLSVVQRGYVDSASSSAHSLLDIINDVLDLSKIEAGRLQLQPVTTDMLQLVEESIEIISFAAAEKGLEVLLDVDPAMPRLAFLDPVRLKQILANLLSNAVKFTHSGQVELSVRFSHPPNRPPVLHFRVSDTGIGITPDQEKKLFKAFSQADSSTTREFGGTGLGLIISDTLARKMGGKIELSSTPGSGTAFSFSIPVAEESVQPGRSLRRPAVDRCLLVGGSERSREIAARTLIACGVDCRSCATAEEAVAAIDGEQAFDVLLADGPALLDELRSSGVHLPIAVLVVPVNAQGNYSEITLPKPIVPRSLFRAIDVAIGGGNPQSRPLQTSTHMPEGEPTHDFSICIAEDDSTNMILVTSLVQKLVPGATVTKAKNGSEAVDIVHSDPPDIVLMDVQMPVMDGIQATREIRTSAEGKGVPIIALTAGALDSERKRCMDAGMDDFLSKPIDREKLAEVLDRFKPSRNRSMG